MEETRSPAYRPGVAQVGARGPARDLSTTLQGGDTPAQPWTGSAGVPVRVARPPLRYRTRQLRQGWEWSGLGGLVVFVCWGIWAIAQRGAGLIGPALSLLLVAAVAVGVFLLCRLLGKLILERWLGRVRRSAWVSHAITAVFLTAAGYEFLRQTEWIVNGITWLRGLG